ncbi:MAG TPA: toxic anion resistance protein [bacterium]
MAGPALKTKTADKPLEVMTAERATEDLHLVSAEPEKVDSELEKQAEEFFKQLLSAKVDDNTKRTAIDEMGLRTQQEAALKSKMLGQPIKNLMALGEDGGPVASSLVDLKLQMEELDPSGIDLSAPGWGVKLLGKLPLLGNPLNRYFTKYQKADTVIAAIVYSLDQGGAQLKRDTTTLAQDQQFLKGSLQKLVRAIQLGQLIDQKLSHALETQITEEGQYNFIEQELLFPLRQRIQDLQQTLAVTQQSIIAMEILIRNNRELIRGVNRAKNVSVVALQVGVTVALALANQKIVLSKVNALNVTTSNIIAGTAKTLKTTGAEIHKQASSTMLDMQKLKDAFADVKSAMEDIANFRREALPQMAQNILELDRLTAEQAKEIEKMERGNLAQSKLVIDVE